MDIKRIASEAQKAEQVEAVLVKLQAIQLRGWDEFRAFLEVLSAADIALPKGFLVDMFADAQAEIDAMLRKQLKAHEENIQTASNGGLKKVAARDTS
jgi:hypothetical protein